MPKSMSQNILSQVSVTSNGSGEFQRGENESFIRRILEIFGKNVNTYMVENRLA
jgi:hypothetical protein